MRVPPPESERALEDRGGNRTAVSCLEPWSRGRGSYSRHWGHRASIRDGKERHRRVRASRGYPEDAWELAIDCADQFATAAGDDGV